MPKTAGRKPVPESQKRRKKMVSFAPDIIDYLATQHNASALLEALVRQSDEFKKWELTKNDDKTA